MKLASMAGWLSLVAFLTVPAGAQETSKAQATYEGLVQRAKSGDTTVDFRQLRLAYVDSDNYPKSADTASAKKEMMAALGSKDFSNAIRNAETVLACNYADMDAHFAEYIAHSELKNADQAESHKVVLKALLKSITDSGDGTTPETAFQVIEVHEEYVILQFMGVMGLPESQSFLKKNGHSYDEIRFLDPKSKQPAVIYFNVDIPVKHGL